MKILFLTPSDETLPCVRFRARPFAARGTARGHETLQIGLSSNVALRLPVLATIPAADICVVHQHLLSPWELSMIRRRCGAVVFDFDEAVWTLPEHETARRIAKTKALAQRFATQAGEADLCVAGNRGLAAKACEYSENVRMVSTGLDTSVFTFGPRSAEPDCFQVGWMGADTNMKPFEYCMEQLHRHAGILQFAVVSESQYHGCGENYVFWSKWAPEQEIRQLQSMDVGLVPLESDEFSLGRCGSTILRYMACGVVPVASAAGVNEEIVEHGRNGFLVSNPQEWSECVMRLASDRELHNSMRRAARETVTSQFDHGVVGQQFWEALESL
ncbi:glycosyltransferase family 4 protein [Desulfovibrio oxyclinae]|uniref:glycosyltransferase family 4 protein n=1 Tax=Desulfovibrio oxyclinae TaxID=63560 RepID=UPI00037B3221|nr:glycosyltransferase family 4 protein [Desulfovibrio oxyclinae]